MTVLGYERPDGSVGIRNHVAVVASVACANGVVEAVQRELPMVKTLTHTEGCGRGPKDLILATRTLCGLGKNPNVAGVLVVGLGCEFLKAPMIAGEIKSSGKPVETLVIQESGGSQKTTRRAIELLRGLLDQAERMPKKELSWDKLTLGLDFGGLSEGAARAANPTLAWAADWLVSKGGRVLISASGEVVGSGGTLGERAGSEELAKRIQDVVEEKRNRALSVYRDDGSASVDGLATFATRAKIQDLVEYGDAPTRTGLCMMDAPESGVYALTGMAAGGTQVFVQATEHGTPGGFPIAPVIKVSTSTETYRAMEDDIDLDAGAPGDGPRKELITLLEKVVRGEPTKAEALGNDLMAVLTQGPAF